MTAILLVSLTIIILTAVARLNDIGRDKMAKRWHLRRLGLFAVAISSAFIGIYSIYGKPVPLWLLTQFATGVAAAWLTTPGHPPWWQFITGDYLQQRPDGSFGIAARIAFAIRLAKPGVRGERRTGVDRRGRA